jgi:hypothetical protein
MSLRTYSCGAFTCVLVALFASDSSTSPKRSIQASARQAGAPGCRVSWILIESEVREPSDAQKAERPEGATVLYTFQLEDRIAQPLTFSSPAGTTVNGGRAGPTRHGYTSASFFLSDVRPIADVTLSLQDQSHKFVDVSLRLTD